MGTEERNTPPDQISEPEPHDVVSDTGCHQVAPDSLIHCYVKSIALVRTRPAVVPRGDTERLYCVLPHLRDQASCADQGFSRALGELKTDPASCTSGRRLPNRTGVRRERVGPKHAHGHSSGASCRGAPYVWQGRTSLDEVSAANTSGHVGQTLWRRPGAEGGREHRSPCLAVPVIWPLPPLRSARAAPVPTSAPFRTV